MQQGKLDSWRRLAAGVGALLLVPTAATAQPGPPMPPTELDSELGQVGDEQQRTERRLDELTAREGDARTVLAAVAGELDAAEVELATLVEQLAHTERALARALAAAAAARTQLVQVEAERTEAEADLAGKRQQLDARVRAAFKYGQVSFLQAFAGTRDIADFLNSSTYVSSVLEGDRELVDEVSGLLAAVEQQRRSAAAFRGDVERQASLAEAATVEVARTTEEQQQLTEVIRDRRSDREDALQALAADRSAVESHLVGLEVEGQRIGVQLAVIAQQQAEELAQAEAARAAEARAEREAAAEAAAEEQRRREAADAAQAAEAADSSPSDGDPSAPAPPPAPVGTGGGPGGGAAPAPTIGNWIRPVVGGVTSVYGPRWGRTHHGVDLAGGVENPVVASRGGVVVQVHASCHPTSSFGCGGGFGNYVTVAHASGMATIYAHLASVSVGSGQSVSAGQYLGGVGNSGSSYGSHLHFEVRRSGVPQDPCGYIGC